MAAVDPALPSKAVADMATAFVQVGELMRPILEASAGYRAQVIAAGFCVDAADMMAVEYHAALLALIRNANPTIFGGPRG